MGDTYLCQSARAREIAEKGFGEVVGTKVAERVAEIRVCGWRTCGMDHAKAEMALRRSCGTF